MSLALYHSEFGYYSKHARIGKAGGDFYTNADVHQLFGAVLADAIAACLTQIPSNKPNNIVEIGAGTGKLPLDILTTLEADYSELAKSIEYLIIEQSPFLAEQQRKSLAGFQNVRWATVNDLINGPISGIVFSNELIDAFPVHRVRVHRDELQEEFVAVENGRFVSEWKAPTTSAVADYLDRQRIALQPDQIIEVNLQAIDWLEQISSAIDKGVLITIDYGDTSQRLYRQDRPNGTLRCFSSHRLIGDPFIDVGLQDITSSVNFTALINYGERAGLATKEFISQSEWLIRNNIIARAERLERSLQAKGDIVSVMKCRQALKDLLLPGGISDNFKILVQRK